MPAIGRTGRAYGISLVPLGIVEPALKHPVPDDIDATGQTELAHGVRLVHFDGLYADGQAVRDLFVAVSHRHEPKDFRFAVADRPVGCAGAVLSSVEQPVRDARRDGRIQVDAAASDAANGLPN